MEHGDSLKTHTKDDSRADQPVQEVGEASSASRQLLRFETESFSDSENASGHYGFPGDNGQSSGPEIQPNRRSGEQQRLSRSLRSAMSASDSAAASGQQAQAAAGSRQASPSRQQADASRDQRADKPASSQLGEPAGLRLPPRERPPQQQRPPGSEAADAAAAAAAPLVAAAAAAVSSGNVAAGRVYHALFRGAQPPRSNASASGTHTPDLAEPLVPGQDARSICSDQGTERSGLLIQPRMSRPASHRALSEVEQQAAARKWDRYRDLFVLWLCASLLTLIISWWWFPLGILVGGSGALGAVSALRHKNKPGADLVMPAGGVQLLGVLTGLFSTCALAINAGVAGSIRCAHVEDCVKLRLILLLVALWFGIMTAICACCAFLAYGLIQVLQPTFYYRQSDVAVPEAENEMSPALLRQETFTPRAAAGMGSFGHDGV